MISSTFRPRRKRKPFSERRRFLAGFETLEDRRMLATWSGDISGNVVWTNSEVQQIVGNVRVLSGATLTIQPGTVVKFNDFQGLSITVEGTLLAQGTAGERIIFTSLRDDTAGGDTNGDGNASLPGAGYWTSIRLNASSTGSVIDQAEMRYGGSAVGAVVVDGGGLTLSNSKVQAAATSGVRIQNSNPTLTNLTFKSNSVAASMDLASNPAISGVTMTSNGVNALLLDGGTLAGDGNWNDPDITYLVNGTITVPANRRLNVAAGQVVKFREFGGIGLVVNGSMAASGSAASPVVFTSTRDDSVGGDAYNDGASPTGAGQWNFIRFNSGSSANVLDHVEVRYSGAVAGGLIVDGAPLTLSNSKLLASSSSGIRIQKSNPTLTNLTFQNNAVAASMDLGSNPAISGVTMNSNGTNALVLDGGSLTTNGHWNDPDITYLVNNTVTVPADLSLSVSPRQVVKFREFGGIGLVVDGSLAATGTALAPVVFTSTRDDTAGGDTYNDGNSPVGLGQWNNIVLNASSTTNVLDHVEVRYGGAVVGAVVVNGGPLTAANLKLQSSATSGIRIQNSNLSLTNVTFQNNAVAASMDLGSNPAISGVTMTNNGVNALLLDGGTLATNGNWNDRDIAYLLNSTVTVPADKTLNVAAGQVIKFREFSGVSLLVGGSLVATGAANSPVIFTTTRDDSVGSDAYNDGASPVGAGQWNSIVFQPTSTGNALDQVEVRYGGAVSGAIVVDGAPLSFTNGKVQASSSSGVRIQNSNPTLKNITFQNNAVAASMDLGSNPAISSVAMVHNGVNALLLDGGNLTVNGNWNDPDITYLMNGVVTVPADKSLSIAAGQVVKIREFAGISLVVNGSVTASGTAAAPIVFTTTRDDSLGGDAYNDGASPTGRGQWNSIVLKSGSTANVLDHVELRFGGAVNGAIFVEGGPLTLTNSKLLSSATNGIRIQGSDPMLTNVSFQSNAAAASMDLGSNPAISGVTMTNNGTNALVLDGGDLTANGIWNDPDITYLINNDVTVPANSTLSIAAGQVIKFREFGGLRLVVNGTLSASGSPTAPIIFTSTRDDTAGGDIYTDGPTPAGAGNWVEIRLNATGSGIFEHVEARYGGGLNSTFFVDGGALSLSRSKVQSSFYPAVRVSNSGTGTLTSNLFFRGSDNALYASAGASLTAVNNTIDGNFRGLVADGASTTVTLVNNLITNNSRGGISRGNSATINASFNNVFNPGAPAGDYEGLPNQTGTNNNISADPKYFSRANGEFRLRAGSPAIDSATSAAAPLLDLAGNPRFDDPNIVNQGTGTMAFVDRGAIERQEISTSDVDLATVAVTAPVAGMQDESVSVSWTTQNVGQGTAGGPWKDAVFLSADPVWSPDDVRLGDKTHTGDLGAGQTYSDSLSVTLPGALPGTYYLIVRSDAQNDVFEALAEVNNSGASAQAITIDLPSLFLGTPVNVQFPTAAAGKLYKIAAPAGADLRVELSGPPGNSKELYLAQGQVPSRQSFDVRDTNSTSQVQRVVISGTQAGNYYVMVSGTGTSSASYTLTATLAGFGISQISPTRGSNTGKVTVTIEGSGFDALSQARLIDSAGGTLNATQEFFTDSGHISATFDLTGRPNGLADVQVIKTGNVLETLPDAFNITTGVTGRLSTTITAPSRVRLARDFEVTINYRNSGDTDLASPILRAIGNGVTQWSLAADRAHLSSEVELLAVNPRGPAGVLPPGASGVIHLFGRSANVGNDVLNVEVAEFPTTPIDWNAVEAGIRPPDLPAAEWNALFAQLKSQIGDTWAGYVAALTENATLLADPRLQKYSLRDVFQIEVEDAQAALHTSVSGRLYLRDAAHPLAGARLSLVNEATSDAIVAVSRSNGTFVFPKVATGSYRLAAEGYLVSGQPAILVGAADISGLSVLATESAAISGRVVRVGSGAPVADVLVSAISTTGQVLGTRTANDGTYRLANLPEGTYDVSVGDGAFVATSRAIVVAGSAEMAQVNLALSAAASVSGRVTGPGGTAVAGAVVLAYGVEGLPVGDAAITNAAGDYTLRGLPSGTFTVQASADGLAPAVLRNQVVTSGAILTGRNLTMAAGGTLQGSVTRQDGSAIPFAMLSAKRGNELIQATQANSDGTFEFIDLPAGDYTVAVAVRGYREVAKTATVAAGQATAMPAVVLSATGGILGVVRRQSDNAPLSDAAITVFSSGVEVAFAFTNADGNYVVPDLAPGSYQVVLGSLASAGVMGMDVTVAAGLSATASFQIPVIGSIAGVVFAADGTTPLADARVSLYLGDQAVSSLFTDDAGAFKFHVLAGGDYSLLASMDGKGFPALTGLAISAGTNLSGMNLVAGTARLQGIVKAQGSNQPLPGAIVHIRGDGIDEITDVVTDSAGRYEFIGVAGSQLQLVSEAAGRAFATAAVALAADGDTTADFTLAPGRAFVGAVRDTSGAPLVGATVAVRNLTLSNDGFTAITDELGRYRIGTLPPGTYDLAVIAAGRQAVIARGAVLGGADEARDYYLGVSNIEVRGFVTDGQGRPLAGVAVEAIDASGNVAGIATTGADGSYVITTLSAGSFVVVASTDGAAPATSSLIAVAAGDVKSGVNLVLSPVAFAVDTSFVPGFGDTRDATQSPSAGGESGIIAGALNLFKHLPRPRRLTEETVLPPLTIPTCGFVIERHRELAAYISLREKMFQTWQENYETGREVKTVNQVVVGLDVVKLAGTAASLTLNTAKVLKNLKHIKLPDPTVGTEVLNAVKGLVDRYDKYFFKFYQLINDYQNAVASGKKPPNISDALLAITKGVKQVFDDIVTFVGDKESIWGKASPAVGAVMGLYDVYKDFNTVAKDFTIAVDNINNISKSTEDAGSLYAMAEGSARSVLDSYLHDVEMCDLKANEPRVNPSQVPPPKWQGGPAAGGASAQVAVQTSFDPNDKTSTSGFGLAGAIQSITLPYKIEFENDPNLGATIPAQEVFITDVLDADLDLATVEFTGFGFNNFVFEVPPGLSRYETTIDLRPQGIELLVPVIMDVNQATRVLSVTFRSLDPLTGQLPDQVDAGFLPVNNKQLHNGEGFFTYTIRPKAGLPTGTEITNQAAIVFDVNAPILTPTTRHTLDVGQPSSVLAALRAKENKAFTVDWSGSDDLGGSGIRNYTIYVSENGGPLTTWQAATSVTSAEFIGATGRHYEFFLVASDQVGNVEPLSVLADAATTISDNPWQNARHRLDVHFDGFIAPSDALAIINDINAFRSRKLLVEPGPTDDFIDANGDTFVSPADALDVINHINAFGSGPVEGEAAEGEAVEGESAEQTAAHFAERAFERAVDWLSLLALDIAGLDAPRRRRG